MACFNGCQRLGKSQFFHYNGQIIITIFALFVIFIFNPWGLLL
jgi:hypothetical protein